jgi:hypothetical protein
MTAFFRIPARHILTGALCLAATAALRAADTGPGYRIGSLSGGTLSVKENSFNAPWIRESDAVSEFALEGDRIGVRKTDGSVLVKEGNLDAPWLKLADDAQAFALSNHRIAVLHRGGALDAKEGGLDAGWVRLAEGVQRFTVYGNRIGILRKGSLEVKEGALDSPWVWQSGQVTDFQFSDDRIGALYSTGLLQVKAGGLSSPWVSEATQVVSFSLSGDRIAALHQRGIFEVKSGDLDASWTRLAEGVDSYDLDGNNIAILQGNVLKVKAGALDAPWTQQADSVQKFQLDGMHLVYLRTNGALLAREGGSSAAPVALASGVQKFQLAFTGRSGDIPETQADLPPGDWQRDNRRGVMTRTLVLESSRGIGGNRTRDVEVLFPEGYSYCRHTLSANRRAGPGGVTIVTAEADRLVFGVWSDGRIGRPGSGGVEITATVTAVRNRNQQGNRRNDNGWNGDLQNANECSALPVAGGGCGESSCQRYLNAAESDGGQCLPAACGYNNSERPQQQVCVYNLRSDDQADERARRLACGETGGDPAPSGVPGDWLRTGRGGELTKTLVLEASPGRSDGRTREVEVLFPAGYDYCRHTLSANRGAGPGGVSIVSVDANRMIFGVWSGGPGNGAGSGGVQVTATVTAIRDNSFNNRSCSEPPKTGGGCGDFSCRRYVDAAEADNGLCQATFCGGGRAGRSQPQICVFNLRDDDQTQARARQIACQNNASRFSENNR